MEEQNKRKAVILMIVGVITLIALVVGATYAYFQAQIGKGESTTLNVKAGTTDDLSFSLSDLDASKDKVTDNDENTPIVIEATQTNFASGNDSLADGVSGTATLIANDENYSATKAYNVYLNITKNELQYTSYIKKEPDETPENILSFKDEAKKAEANLEDYNPRPELYLTIKKNGDEVSKGVTINDKALSYTSDVFTEGETNLGGFDITETKGLIKISVPTEIKVENGNANNHTTTDTWEITVTFMNLETDQHLNTGKSVKGEVLIQSEEYVSQDIKTLNQLLADANKGEETTLYHHDAELEEGAEDDSYRYAGSFEEVKNYVCLDGGVTSEGTCGNIDDDLYRIIGLFKNKDGQYEIKLIKYDYVTSTQLGETGAYSDPYETGYSESDNADDGSNYKGNKENYANIGGYYWTDNSNDVNDWTESELRKTNLNDYYLNSYLKDTKHIDTDKLITTHSWVLNSAYDDMEQIISIDDKIGLMYLSDYEFALSPSTSNYWTGTKNHSLSNWMYMGLTEWTITNSGDKVEVIDYSGYEWVSYFTNGTDYRGHRYNCYYALRPTFYLSSNVQIQSGDGSKEEPYRITID